MLRPTARSEVCKGSVATGWHWPHKLKLSVPRDPCIHNWVTIVEHERAYLDCPNAGERTAGKIVIGDYYINRRDRQSNRELDEKEILIIPRGRASGSPHYPTGDSVNSYI